MVYYHERNTTVANIKKSIYCVPTDHMLVANGIIVDGQTPVGFIIIVITKTLQLTLQYSTSY